MSGLTIWPTAFLQQKFEIGQIGSRENNDTEKFILEMFSSRLSYS